MAAQGRKNVHGKAGVRFKAAYTKSKHENKLRTLVTDLVKYERVTVTSGMVKEPENVQRKDPMAETLRSPTGVCQNGRQIRSKALYC